MLAVRHRPFQRAARVQAGPGPASLPVLILLQRLALLASKFFGSKATGCWHLHFLSPSVTRCFHNLYSYLHFVSTVFFRRTHFGPKVNHF